MKLKILGLIAFLFAVAPVFANDLPDATAEDGFAWPDGRKMAISLSYDDAVDSQLDNALPALSRHGLIASFYLSLASPTLQNRLEEWRDVARQGHELGNHTIFHPCRSDRQGRGWVASHYDLRHYTIDEIVEEITVANAFLHAIDGRTERTFTPPCGDSTVGDEEYIPAISDMFIAVKLFESDDPGFSASSAPFNVDGKDLVERVEEEAAKGTKLFHIIFHGIGGDHLSTSSEAHDRLLEFLAANQDIYWVDSYINIMKYATANDFLR